MPNGWKQFEAESAALFGVHRCWANSGERLDFPQTGELTKTPVRGQCKLVKVLSLNELTKLCEEVQQLAHSDLTVIGTGFGVVCTKVRRGRGHESPPIIAMTFEAFKRMQSYYLEKKEQDAVQSKG